MTVIVRVRMTVLQIRSVQKNGWSCIICDIVEWSLRRLDSTPTDRNRSHGDLDGVELAAPTSSLTTNVEPDTTVVLAVATATRDDRRMIK